MSIGQQLLAEFEQELHATRRVLERIPEEHYGWRAHPTSMSLGQLALHVAAVPGGVLEMIQADSMEAPDFQQAEATSRSEVMAALDSLYPGLSFRVIDEQGQIRPHMKIFVGEQMIRDLGTSVPPGSEVYIVGALSGG